MDQDQLRALFEQVRGGAVDVDAAIGRMRHMPFEDLGFAKVDHHRALRHGMPEVIFAQRQDPGAGRRASPDACSPSAATCSSPAPTAPAPTSSRPASPKPSISPLQRHSRLARPTVHGKGRIAVVCAGTSDIPVAEEAQVTAEFMGNDVDTIHDIGVAGIHRLMSNRERLTQARVIVVCAGMEGALPSVVGGLVSCPVIAVPTSVGYGASFHGLAALLGMLNSCASNVTVVNIDNGFGAGYVASLINRLVGTP